MIHFSFAQYLSKLRLLLKILFMEVHFLVYHKNYLKMWAQFFLPRMNLANYHINLGFHIFSWWRQSLKMLLFQFFCLIVRLLRCGSLFVWLLHEKVLMSYGQSALWVLEMARSLAIYFGKRASQFGISRCYAVLVGMIAQ